MNLIAFFKKQKIILFLSLILLILIIIKLSLSFVKKEEPTPQPSPPKDLEEEKEYQTIPSPLETKEKEEDVFASPQPDEKIKEIDQDEFPYDPVGEALREALKEKPWLLDFPIFEKNYSISFMESKNSFRVLMKIDITSPLSREQQIEQIKAEAPEKIKEKGVNLNQYGLYYTFTP